MPYNGPYNVKFQPGGSLDPVLQAMNLTFCPGFAKTWANPSEDAFYQGTVSGLLLGVFDPEQPGWVHFRKPFDREPIDWNACTCGEGDDPDEFGHMSYCNLAEDLD